MEHGSPKQQEMSRDGRRSYLEGRLEDFLNPAKPNRQQASPLAALLALAS